MHRFPENEGALFQVASQFNMPEMVGPNVTPEAGVTGYQHDHTQGPSCAMACGAATIFRNYLVPIASATGQTSTRQLNGLADFSAEMSKRVGNPTDKLWTMRNGYALPTRQGLTAVTGHLSPADQESLDVLRSSVRFGVQTDAEVTDGPGPGPLVSQIFCSALPVAYSNLPASLWSPFARLVLESAYEATWLAGLLNASRGALKRVLLTRLGGEHSATTRSGSTRRCCEHCGSSGEHDLDVVIVSYGRPTPNLTAFIRSSGFDLSTRDPS